jgi:hypothetical protein
MSPLLFFLLVNEKPVCKLTLSVKYFLFLYDYQIRELTLGCAACENNLQIGQTLS